MPKIFLSYRRSDSAAITGRIFDRLASEYGNDSVCVDIDSIPYGSDFFEHIDKLLREIDIVVAVVGPRWLGPRDGAAERIHDENDPISIEIQTALREGAVIIPVLVDGAIMPTESQLPETIREFTHRNAVRVDTGVDFHAQVNRLTKSIELHLGDKHITPGQGPKSSQNATLPGTAPDLRVALFSSPLPRYLAVSAALLVLAHYLIVVTFDLHALYLRGAAVIIPMAAGFMLYSKARRGAAEALLLGTSVGFVSVLGMLASVAMTDGTPLIPTMRRDWQELVEYLASIALATVAGNALSRTLQSFAKKSPWRTRREPDSAIHKTGDSES